MPAAGAVVTLADLVGAAATAASVASFAPQAWKIIRTRDTKSISAGTYALTVLGFVLWLTYGALLGQWPLILTNAVCCALAAFILVMKLLPAERKQAIAEAIDPKG